jgi:hypothetical protein
VWRCVGGAGATVVWPARIDKPNMKRKAAAVPDSVIDAAYRRRAALVIPRRLLQGLRDATSSDLQRGEIAGQGTALTWPALDVDFTVLALLRGVYGGRRWMSELARLAGATTSPVKAAAARANGRKGGRPRQSSPHTQRVSARKR